jgi:hypothetical protein
VIELAKPELRTTAKSPEAGRLYLAPLLVGFGLARFAAEQAGVRFRPETMKFFAQLLDPLLLRERLLESLVHLHSQPPLYNLLTGVALKLSPSDPGQLLGRVFLAASLITCLVLASALHRLGLGRWLASLLALAFVVSPPFLLYENWYFYPHLSLMLLTCAGYSLLRSDGRPSRWLTIGFWLLAGLVWLRSLFHPLYFVAVEAVVILLARPVERRRILLSAAVPLVLVLGLALKNFALFGFFGTSSWGGNSFHRMFTETLEREVLTELVERGAISPLSLEWEFERPEVYLEVLDIEPRERGIPALDTTRKTLAGQNPVNYNHWVYPIASREYMGNAMWLLKYHPDAYLRSLRWTARRFLDPVTDTIYLRANRNAIPNFVRAAEDVERSAIYRGVMLAGLVYALLALVRPGTARAERLFLAFAVGTILWVAAGSILFEYGENNRFRYQILSLGLMLVAYLGRDLVWWLSRRWGRPPAESEDSAVVP